LTQAYISFLILNDVARLKMSSRFLLYCILLLISVSVFAQEEEVIPWSAERKLQWSDFKGTYLKTEWAAATTASGISYSFKTFEKDDQWYLDFKVNCEFFPQKSWYQPKLCDSLILSHEQLHFDIAELHARKMRKRIASTTFTKNVKKEVREIYKDILKELMIFQNKYDRETNFSRDRPKQLLWNKMIAEALTKE